jgi:hypothetical protein
MRSPCFSPGSNHRNPLGKRISFSFLISCTYLSSMQSTLVLCAGAGWPSEVTRFYPPMPLGDKAQGGEKASHQGLVPPPHHQLQTIGDYSESDQSKLTLHDCKWKALGTWLATVPMGLIVSPLLRNSPASTRYRIQVPILTALRGWGGTSLIPDYSKPLA